MNSTEFEKYKKSINRTPLLYLGEREGEIFQPADKSIYDFIKNFFKVYKSQFFTYIVSTNVRYCERSKLRSIQDVHALVRYYFPKVELTTTLNILFCLAQEQIIFGKWYCNTIRKYVFDHIKTPYDDISLRNAIILTTMNIKIMELANYCGFYEEDFSVYDEDNDD
jgi:hypothetical protein